VPPVASTKLGDVAAASTTDAQSADGKIAQEPQQSSEENKSAAVDITKSSADPPLHKNNKSNREHVSNSPPAKAKAKATVDPPKASTADHLRAHDSENGSTCKLDSSATAASFRAASNSRSRSPVTRSKESSPPQNMRRSPRRVRAITSRQIGGTGEAAVGSAVAVKGEELASKQHQRDKHSNGADAVLVDVAARLISRALDGDPFADGMGLSFDDLDCTEAMLIDIDSGLIGEQTSFFGLAKIAMEQQEGNEEADAAGPHGADPAASGRRGAAPDKKPPGVPPRLLSSNSLRHQGGKPAGTGPTEKVDRETNGSAVPNGGLHASSSATSPSPPAVLEQWMAVLNFISGWKAGVYSEDDVRQDLHSHLRKEGIHDEHLIEGLGSTVVPLLLDLREIDKAISKHLPEEHTRLQGRSMLLLTGVLRVVTFEFLRLKSARKSQKRKRRASSMDMDADGVGGTDADGGSNGIITDEHAPLTLSGDMLLLAKLVKHLDFDLHVVRGLQMLIASILGQRLRTWL